MKRGNYIVFKSTGWAARAIQFGTRSRWNHAAIYVGSGKVIEANPSGITVTDLATYPVGAWVTSRLPLTEAQRDVIVAYAWARRGARYGWLDILALCLVALGLGREGGWIVNRAKRDDRLVCSQLVAYAYAEAGVPLGPDAWAVTPGDLADDILTTP